MNTVAERGVRASTIHVLAALTRLRQICCHPDLVGNDWTSYWVYVAGPLVGAIVAVGVAYVLRGRGGGRSGSLGAQGELAPQIEHSEDA